MPKNKHGAEFSVVKSKQRCILTETGAEPSLQATQMRLKRARLADNLNEKISQRPGPMELVEKNILPVDSTLKQAIIGENHATQPGLPARASPPCGGARRMEAVKTVRKECDVTSLSHPVFCSVGQVNYPKVLDEDSGDALSPEQPASQESQGSLPSPLVPETPSPTPSLTALPSVTLQV